MSTQTLTRFLCDAPHCQAAGIGSDNITPPDGWTRLNSTAHIPAPTGPASIYPARRRSRTLSYSERCYGSFTLHLCPQHPDAFADHQPRTNGHGYNSNVTVSCSCGAALGSAPAAAMVGKYPSHAPEAAWYRHLPLELRWYLWRGQTQWALSRRSAYQEHVMPYGDEASARQALARISDSVLVRRATDADEWEKATD